LAGEIASHGSGMSRHVRRHRAVRPVAGNVGVDGEAVRGRMVRGILPDEEDRVADFRPARSRVAELDDLLPDELRRRARRGAWRVRCGVFTGDKVTVIAPQGTVTPAGVVPRLKIVQRGRHLRGRHVRVRQRTRADPHRATRKRLYRMADRVSGVRLKLDDLFVAPRVARSLAGKLDINAFISDWTRSHANFFRAVQIEKNMMFIILSLIVAVAAFNIVSTLVMAVTDKQSDIAILRTLGASPGSIMAVFIVQGALIGFIGLGLGVAGGVALALNVDVVVPFIERILGTQFLAKEVYYISNLPSELQWRDVTTITGVAFVLALVATIYPSWRAARVNPAAALRYE
jgi:lipoprotein-releasing system permease protein